MGRHHKPQHDFYNRLGSHIKERHILPGFYHDTLGEQDREIAFVEMRRFIRERFNQPLQQVDLTQAHLFGDSRREADELATPLPVCTPRGAFWAIYRASLKLGSRWSEGLKIGKKQVLIRAAHWITFTAINRKAATLRRMGGQILSQRHRLARYPPTQSQYRQSHSDGLSQTA